MEAVRQEKISQTN